MNDFASSSGKSSRGAGADAHDEEDRTKAGVLKKRIRDRLRTVKKRVLAIALSSRQQGERAEHRRGILSQADAVIEEVHDSRCVAARRCKV